MADPRSRTILVTSHCILNQNAVVQPLARARGAMVGAVSWASDRGYGIVQLPCPEFAFLGPNRPGMSVEQYDTPQFRAQNRRLLAPVVEQLLVYQENGYTIVGGMFVEDSPSCDPRRGVWVDDFLAAAHEAGLRVEHLWQIPSTRDGAVVEGDPRIDVGPAPVRRLPVVAEQGRAMHGCGPVHEPDAPREPPSTDGSQP